MMEDPSYWYNNMYLLDYFSKATVETLKMTAGISAAIGGLCLFAYALKKGADTIGQNLGSDGVRNLPEEKSGLEKKFRSTFPLDS